ncbi:hypothetical protein V501_01052 [Pseudogymnoascus sp. VKM F-4519 (FW-2642)]|nr:hypothetical protein V501_01052 [Pseudogymnoascus sp. VKM F-4519 (FW-2642)]
MILPPREHHETPHEPIVAKFPTPHSNTPFSPTNASAAAPAPPPAILLSPTILVTVAPATTITTPNPPAIDRPPIRGLRLADLSSHKRRQGPH